MEPKIREKREIDSKFMHLKNELTSLDQLGEFDVVGFDADHTLVRYKVQELTKMIDAAYMKTLLEHCEGYPEDIETLFDDSALDIR